MEIALGSVPGEFSGSRIAWNDQTKRTADETPSSRPGFLLTVPEEHRQMRHFRDKLKSAAEPWGSSRSNNQFLLPLVQRLLGNATSASSNSDSRSFSWVAEFSFANTVQDTGHGQGQPPCGML